AERLWRQRLLNRIPHSRKVFSRLANRIRISGVIQSQHNKKKLAFCNWIKEQSSDFHLKILFSDECTFKSDWCGIIRSQIVNPIFFENNLDSNKYSVLLEIELLVLLENFLRLCLDMWFQ
ncbi:hypothetical protein ALC53_05463, partial [Atta colombica]